MRLWVYYILSWLWGVLTLALSFGGAFAFTQYISSVPLEEGKVTGGHMNIMEFVLPLLLIGLICFILYLCFSLFCIFRKNFHKCTIRRVPLVKPLCILLFFILNQHLCLYPDIS